MPVWLPLLGAKKRVDAGEGLIQQRDQAVAEDRPGIIIDIGDQNSKIIYLDRRYNIKNFTMNEKCAAGTGKFMEVAAPFWTRPIPVLMLSSTAMSERMGRRSGWILLRPSGMWTVCVA